MDFDMETQKMGMVFRFVSDVLSVITISGHERKVRAYMADGMSRCDAEYQVSIDDNECYIHA